MTIKLTSRTVARAPRVSGAATTTDAKETRARRSVTARNGENLKGLVQTNGVVADEKRRVRQSGQMVRTVNPRTPMSAIRSKCLDCSGGSFGEIELCEITGCPLYKWRFGKRPVTGPKRVMSAAQVAASEKLVEAGRKRRAAKGIKS